MTASQDPHTVTRRVPRSSNRPPDEPHPMQSVTVSRTIDAPPEAVEREGGTELAGLTFVFTGSVEGYARSDLQELVERHGAAAVEEVFPDHHQTYVHGYRE